MKALTLRDPSSLLPEISSYPWHNDGLRQSAEARAEASLKAWDLRTRFPDMEAQALLQLGEFCRLLLQDYLEAHGAKMTFSPASGTRHPLTTTDIPLPVTILRLRRTLKEFPLWNFQILEPHLEFVVSGHSHYLAFPFLDETCLVTTS